MVSVTHNEMTARDQKFLAKFGRIKKNRRRFSVLITCARMTTGRRKRFPRRVLLSVKTSLNTFCSGLFINDLPVKAVVLSFGAVRAPVLFSVHGRVNVFRSIKKIELSDGTTGVLLYIRNTLRETYLLRTRALRSIGSLILEFVSCNAHSYGNSKRYRNLSR